MNQFEITMIGGQPRKKKFRFWLGMFGLIIAVPLIWFLLDRSSFSGQAVDFNIEAPGAAASGDQVIYLVKYHNRNQEALKNVKLTFFYPPTSTVVKDKSFAKFLTEEVAIGEIVAGAEGEKKFSAFLAGDRGDAQKARARLVFSLESVRSSFAREAKAVTEINSLPVALTLTAPEKAVSGQTISYALNYRNETAEEIELLRAKFDYPDGFVFQRAEPAPSTGNNFWELKKIAPSEENKITVEGAIRGAEKENRTIKVTLQKMVEGLWVDYERTAASTALGAAPLTLALTVNDQTSYSAKLGDVLNYQLRFTNNSEIDLKKLAVSLWLEGGMFDLSSLQSDGRFEAGTRTVSWDFSVNPLLEKLAPGQTGAVNLKVGLKNSFTGGGALGARDFVVKVIAKAETSTIPPDFSGDRLTAQTELTARIKSLPSFEQLAVYQDEVFGSEGPLPPRVNQKTFYTVVWRLTNSAGETVKTKMRANLPLGVKWEEKTRASDNLPVLTYQKSNREVVWEVGALPAGIGQTVPAYEARFQVSVTPSADQAGEVLTLVKNLILEGEDSYTRQAFVLRGSDLDPDHLTDQPNQGTVAE